MYEYGRQYSYFSQKLLLHAFYLIDLDEDYSYTVIGVPNRKYVWIMSRESSMNSDIFETIINKLKKVGYDTTQIKTIKQEW